MAKNPMVMEFKFRNRRYKDAATGLETFQKVLKSGWDGSAKILSNELRVYLNAVADALAQRHSGAWPAGTGEKTLSKRSGALTASILSSVKITGSTFGDLEGHIGGNFYARVHEFGAVIKPKKAKYLTIPLPAAMDSRGIPLKKSARDWENTFVAKSKKGNLIIFQKQGTVIVPLYVLRTQVTIPARLGMQKTLVAGLPYFVDQTMDAMVKSILEKQNG